MLHQDSAPWKDVRAANGRAASASMGVLAYRSRAVTEPSNVDLDRILANAQKRNRAEGVTGILLYERGHFFQWLEGPPASLSRVWDSILRDRRHADIQVLRENALARRFFKAWHMGFARCKTDRMHRLIESVDAPPKLLEQLAGRPTALVDPRLNELISSVVIPRLHQTHLEPAHLQREVVSLATPAVQQGVVISPQLWHAAQGIGADLARILLSEHSEQTAGFVDRLYEEGASVNSLYDEVFEPAQRHLGEMWQEDLCNDFYLTLALARLQIEVRRIGAHSARRVPYSPGARSVLMSPQPGELHGVGIAMSSELFYRGGWDVTCEFPINDATVCDLVHGRWFDVLELSLSDALRRDHQLPAMRKTIVAARAASLNPTLTVMVHGRSFFEQPRAYREIGADSDCMTPPGSGAPLGL
jgi:hypothetical protein